MKNTEILAYAIFLVGVLVFFLSGYLIILNSHLDMIPHDHQYMIQIMDFSAENATVENTGHLNVTLINLYVNETLDSEAVFSKTELAPSEIATITLSKKLDMNCWFELKVDIKEGGSTEVWLTTPILSSP